MRPGPHPLKQDIYFAWQVVLGKVPLHSSVESQQGVPFRMQAPPWAVHKSATRRCSTEILAGACRGATDTTSLGPTFPHDPTNKAGVTTNAAAKTTPAAIHFDDFTGSSTMGAVPKTGFRALAERYHLTARQCRRRKQIDTVAPCHPAPSCGQARKGRHRRRQSCRGTCPVASRQRACSPGDT